MSFAKITGHSICLVWITAFSLYLFSCQPKAEKAAYPESVPGADTTDFAEMEQQYPAFRLNQQGDSAFETGNYTAAIALYQRSMDTAAAYADSFLYYDSKLDLACVHDRVGECSKAVETALPVVEAFIRSGDSARIGRAYTALGGFYGRAGMPDESLDAGKKGFDLLKFHGSPIERCAAYNQMAFTYSERGRWAQALPLLDTALLFMRASGVLNQLPGMYLNIGDCQRQLRHWPEARMKLRAATRLADSLGQAHVRAVALKRLSQVEESAGNTAEALRLFQQSAKLKDSIFTAEKARNLQELEVRYQTDEKERDLLVLQAQRKTDLLRRDFAVALLAILLAGALWQLFQWQKKRRLDQHALGQKAIELREFADLLVLKNTRLAELEQAVKRAPIAPQNPDNDSGAAQASAALRAETDLLEDFYNHNILTDKDWSVFKNYFDRSNPHFRQRLRQTYPDLTNAEERLFLLLKINLSTKESAVMQGISNESVKKTRYRLRKRLGLSEDEGLEDFVRKF